MKKAVERRCQLEERRKEDEEMLKLLQPKAVKRPTSSEHGNPVLKHI